MILFPLQRFVLVLDIDKDLFFKILNEKIIKPNIEDYHGRGLSFEKQFRGKIIPESNYFTISRNTDGFLFSSGAKFSGKTNNENINLKILFDFRFNLSNWVLISSICLFGNIIMLPDFDLSVFLIFLLLPYSLLYFAFEFEAYLIKTVILKYYKPYIVNQKKII